MATHRTRICISRLELLLPTKTPPFRVKPHHLILYHFVKQFLVCPLVFARRAPPRGEEADLRAGRACRVVRLRVRHDRLREARVFRGLGVMTSTPYVFDDRDSVYMLERSTVYMLEFTCRTRPRSASSAACCPIQFRRAVLQRPEYLQLPSGTWDFRQCTGWPRRGGVDIYGCRLLPYTTRACAFRPRKSRFKQDR